MNELWIDSRHEKRIFLNMNFIRLALLCLCLMTYWVPSLIFAGDEVSKSSENYPDIPALALGLKNRPRWEIGVGAGHIRGYDYPASRDHNRRTIALPFFIYRTQSIRFGGGGIRAVAIENPRIKLDLSVGGSLNANSSGGGVREGMPDLDFLFEIGPQLEVLLRDEVIDGGSRLQSRFTSEIRAVFVTDFDEVDRQGLVAEAGLDINLRNVKGFGIDIGAGIEFTYANEKLQDYFYEVPAQYATPARPEFDAKGGYLESKLSVGMGFRPHNNVAIFLGVFTGLYGGAANENSPLFETTSQTGFAFGVVWTIAKSRTMVEVIELGRNQ
jgi:outer membrane protein